LSTRPSKAAIEALQSENQQLRELLAASSPELQRTSVFAPEDGNAYHEGHELITDHGINDDDTLISPSTDASGHLRSNSDAMDTGTPPTDPALTEMTPVGKIPSPHSPTVTIYHGPTSTHYEGDEAPTGPEGGFVAPNKSSWRGTLVSASAIERQKEHLNHVARKYG
jgi:hypothetical protein